MENNVKKDLSTLTTISEVTLNKLINLYMYCIANAVEDAILNNEQIASIDIGIGTLLITINQNDIKYKFKPNQKLERAIIDTVINEKNSLELICEQSLVQKLEHVYKDFF